MLRLRLLMPFRNRKRVHHVLAAAGSGLDELHPDRMLMAVDQCDALLQSA